MRMKINEIERRNIYIAISGWTMNSHNINRRLFYFALLWAHKIKWKAKKCGKYHPLGQRIFFFFFFVYLCIAMRTKNAHKTQLFTSFLLLLLLSPSRFQHARHVFKIEENQKKVHLFFSLFFFYSWLSYIYP